MLSAILIRQLDSIVTYLLGNVTDYVPRAFLQIAILGAFNTVDGSQ